MENRKQPILGQLFGWENGVALLELHTWLVTLGSQVALRGQGDLSAAERNCWPLAVQVPAGLWAGVAALHAVTADALMILIAGVLVVYLVLDRLGRTDLPWARAHPTLLAAPFGLAAGFSEGALNVAGPVLLIYFLLLDLPVVSLIATLNWLFLAG